MPILHSDPWCARCYAESASRAAHDQEDPAVRAIILRTARALIERKGVTVTEATHAMHPKRRRPWPSDKTAAAA